jgi:TATA-box binding protein (TBP) (component of TFIID and TFIIIB)
MNPIVSISNLVFTCNIGQKIDPYLVCHALGGKVGAKFPSCFVKLKDPNITLSIFHTGSIIATGCPSVESAIQALYTTLNRLSQACNRPFMFYDFQIVLLVCSTKLNYNLNLYLMHKHFGLSAQWTPENFPGVKLELPYKKWTLVAFDSGTLIITGFVEFQEIPKAIDFINNEMNFERFKKGSEMFNDKEVKESCDFETKRINTKRVTHGNKYSMMKARRLVNTHSIPQNNNKQNKSHTRFRKEDNSITFAMNAMTARNKPHRRVNPY